MRKIVIVFMMTLISNLGFCQHSTRDFRNLFDEIEFDIVSVYTFERQFSNFLDTSAYPFTGKEIDSTFTQLLIGYSTTPSHMWDEYHSSFFAGQRFYLTSKYEGLLVREYLYNKDRDEEASALHLLVYDNEAENIIDAVQLALSQDNKESSASKISWLLDINDDGNVDIIQYFKSDFYNPMKIGPAVITTDTTKVMVLRDERFVSIPVEDTEMKKQVEDDFLYTLKPGMAFRSRQILFRYVASRLEERLDTNTLNINIILTDNYSETGPFSEGQKRECYFVCIGEVNAIGEQHAYDEIKACADITFSIHEVLFSKNAGKQNYHNEQYCMAGCLGMMPPGTKVLIFVYEQNGEYTIYNNYWSGSQSILTIDSYDAPIIQSVKKYLDANQNPQVLKDDLDIWAEYGLGNELEKILQTKE